MAICPCDQPKGDTCLDIPPGLHTLPRQARGFGEIRARLLQSAAAQPALHGWTGEAEQDLGVMLLDMWAYALDIAQFYDAKITDEFYLGTAKRDLSTHRIIRLLGYTPAPAMAAEAVLAGEVTQPGPLTLPAKSGFRSEAFGDEPPQVFQTLAAQLLEPARNRWQIDDIDDEDYPGRVLLRPSENGVPKRGVVAFALHDASSDAWLAHHATEITGRREYVGGDDRKMAEVLLEDALNVPAGTPVGEIRMRLMGLRAGPSPLSPDLTGNTMYLDTVYPQLKAGDLAVLETDAEMLVPFRIEALAREELILEKEIEGSSDTVKIPVMVSKVTIPAGTSYSLSDTAGWRLHFNPLRVGALRAPYKSALALDDMEAGAPLRKPRHPQSANVLSGDFMLHGAGGAGVEVSGQVERDDVTRDLGFTPDPGQDAFAADLQTPVSLYGNLIHTVRTEQVTGEVLGSADVSQSGNRFKLKKAPLTWITDSSKLSGRRPLIEVRVDGVVWDRVESFYTATPDDRVYRLETDAKGATWVVFGDGRRGERPQSGTGNVTASYGHGAGAAKPPAAGITQLARPVKGLGRVLNPVACTGGADAESAVDIRDNAPASVLTLGRAVSVQDFTALARTFNGVLNVASGWAWHETRQRAVVTLWVAGDGTLDLDELQGWLRGMAATDTPLAVELATPVARTLAISVDVLAGHPSDETRAAAQAALEDPSTGLLAVRNVPIGGVIYRSAIVKAVQTVSGVEAVPSVLLDGAEMDWAVKASAGTYADFTNSITVS